MLDKLVETLFATAARNEEKSFLPLFWFGRLSKNCAQVSTASPAIISYAGWQGAEMILSMGAVIPTKVGILMLSLLRR